MTEGPVIRVITREGIFLYDGMDAQGRAKWPFFRRKKNGKVRHAPTPKRWKNILKSQQRKQREREQEAARAA